MALIHCPECGKEISDRAAVCPNCGVPLAEAMRNAQNGMFCPKCGSHNVSVQMVTEQKLVKKRHGILYWIFFIWIFDVIFWFIKWFFFTVPALIFKLFGIGGKKMQIKNTHKAIAVCQNCGNSWEV